MRQINLKAMAKINLGLDVVRRREDGYHDLRMVMQTVKIYDRIRLSATRSGGVRLKTNLGFLPLDKSNHAYMAAQMLIDEFGIKDGVFIDLQKHIPVAAGLAGGSSDAAAVLVGMNILFKLGLSPEELRLRGVKIGADVPYCIMRGTALAEGIGDVLTPLERIPDCSILVAKPDVRVSTKYVYTHLELNENTLHPDIDGQIEAIRAGDLKGMCERCGNVLEDVTESAFPKITALKKLMKDGGALVSMMSGSGPSVFGIFEDRQKAQAMYEQLRSAGDGTQVFLTEPFFPRLR
ncbi:MAG: 4-(cytidine 5'-diphospho)-2-C-methyl-D-erythritol kinase [Lachnospiraceae bacterium]|nr:4-(cytidine 5'-diphospho)-2-C-methyl-D-erythritol kinase [Lachnospiraceae bacterium]